MSATSSTWSIATFDTCGMLILVVLRVSYFIRSTWYISCTSINTYPAGTRCTRLRFDPECTYLYSHNTKCSRSYFVVLYPAGIYEVYNKYISDSSHPSDTRRVSLHILLIDLYLTPVLLAWRSLSYCCSGIQSKTSFSICSTPDVWPAHQPRDTRRESEFVCSTQGQKVVFIHIFISY